MERESQSSHFPPCVLSPLVPAGPTPARPLSGVPNLDLHGPLGHLMAWETQNLKALGTVKSSAQMETADSADTALASWTGMRESPPLQPSHSRAPAPAASLEGPRCSAWVPSFPKEQKFSGRTSETSYRGRWEEGMSESEGGPGGFLPPVLKGLALLMIKGIHAHGENINNTFEQEMMCELPRTRTPRTPYPGEHPGSAGRQPWCLRLACTNAVSAAALAHQQGPGVLAAGRPS